MINPLQITVSMRRMKRGGCYLGALMQDITQTGRLPTGKEKGALECLAMHEAGHHGDAEVPD